MIGWSACHASPFLVDSPRERAACWCLQPESKSGSDTDAVRQELAENLISGNLMLVLVRNLPKLEFEVRGVR